MRLECELRTLGSPDLRRPDTGPRVFRIFCASESRPVPSDPSETIPPPGPDADQPARKQPPKKGKESAVWLTLIGVGAVLLLLLFLAQLPGRPQTLSLSEFETGLDDATFTAANVHQLKFDEEMVRFSNRPLDPEEIGLVAADQAGDATATAPVSDPSSDPEDAATQPITKAEDFRQYEVPLIGLSERTRFALAERLKEAGIEVSGTTAAVNWQFVIGLVSCLVLLGLAAFLLLRWSGAGNPLSIGRSRGKLYSDDDIPITFDDVAGQDEATAELREIVEFLRHPGKYQALGGRIPKGVLLVGPPGTGKTLLAKAVAGEAGVPFFSLSGSDFVEMYVGVGAARVRDMFQQAVAKSPSIIFIDELDALGKVRGSGMPGGHDEREQTLNALLVEMDGFASDDSVIVMGATNRPETLDPALMRPGRFDRNVLVDRPDYKGREAILRVHAEKIRLADGVDLDRLAKLTPGFVGADLANLCNEAALLAARAGKDAVGNEELEEAIERVVAGLEKASKVIQQDEKLRVAYHECGHALVACVLPNTDPVHKISIIPRGLGALGYTLQRPEEDRHLVTVSELRNRICCLLGGIAAEDTVFEEASTGASNDLERSTDMARRMVTEFGMSRKMGRVNYRQTGRSPFLAGASTGSNEFVTSEKTLREIDEEVKRIIDESMATAREIMRDHRGVLERMTQELLEIEVMDAEQLRAILDEMGVEMPPSRPPLKGGSQTIAPPDSELVESARAGDI